MSTLKSDRAPVTTAVLSGEAKIAAGDGARSIRGGDVVTVPEAGELRLDAVGSGAFEAVAIGTSASRDHAPATLEGLYERVEARAAAARSGPLFALLRPGVLDDPARQARLFAGVQVLSDAFQTVLLTRQATCRDRRFFDGFHTHFLEELKREGRTRPKLDPALAATATWFCRRMLVLDSIDKAVLVHFVLEAAGADFHAAAKEAFAGGSTDAYVSAQSEADAEHKNVPVELLQGHDERTYRRLYALVDDGWNMFDAFGRRVAQIVLAEDPS